MPHHTAMHVYRRLRHGGARWLLDTVRDRIAPARPADTPAMKQALQGLSGLEIGGPSRIFRTNGSLPAYAWLDKIDSVNFAAATAWEPNLREGGDFLFNPSKPCGRQYLREATALHELAAARFDAVLSSHCLEHVANPLAALIEWRRVTRPGGHLLVVLPDPARTFDHRRPITSLAHLESDFARQVTEDDLTHLDEVLALHDLNLDPHAGDRETFAARCRANTSHRCMHHHVFDLDLLEAALSQSGWCVHSVQKLAPMHLLGWAYKPDKP